MHTCIDRCVHVYECVWVLGGEGGGEYATCIYDHCVESLRRIPAHTHTDFTQACTHTNTHTTTPHHTTPQPACTLATPSTFDECVLIQNVFPYSYRMHSHIEYVLT